MCVTRNVGRKMSLASKEHAIIIDLQSDDTKLAWHATVTFSSNVDKGAKAEGPHMLLLKSFKQQRSRFNQGLILDTAVYFGFAHAKS